jgi:uncharacterized protein (DUF1697 family)
MTTVIALLRAINVGGRRMAAMADLRAMLDAMGFGAARSLLQSGNLVFDSPGPGDARLEALLEGEAEKRLGLRTDFLVRTAGEWRAIVAANPFPREAKDDPAHLLMTALKGSPIAGGVAALREAIAGRERALAHGREIYVVYPDGIGRSRLTGALIERKLGVRGTARNWNTVLKLAALAAA